MLRCRGQGHEVQVLQSLLGGHGWEGVGHGSLAGGKCGIELLGLGPVRRSRRKGRGPLSGRGAVRLGCTGLMCAGLWIGHLAGGTVLRDGLPVLGGR